MRETIKPGRLAIVAALVLLAGAIGLRSAHTVNRGTGPLPLQTSTVIVIGVTGRSQLTPSDIRLWDRYPGRVAAGAISVRPREIGECAAAGWTTLGAGRRVSAAGLCHPGIGHLAVLDWPQRMAAAAAHHGDAHLGTLAQSVRGCIEAVGPGAALAAARPDGTVALYRSVAAFIAGGMRTSCPLVLVDAGEDSDRIAAAVAGRPGTTVIVTGIGPSEGSHASALQEIYLAPAVRGGWLTSASTRRTGVVDLTDLTSTLIDRSGDTAVTPSVVDGSALQLTIGAVNAADEQQHLRAVAALSDAVIPVDIGLGAVGVAAVAVWVVSTRRRNYALARVPATAGCSAPAAMLLTGAVPWSSTVAPITTLALSWVGWAVLLTLSVLAISRRTGWPTAAVAAALTVAAFTAEAVLGGPMEPGSLLNSRPVNGGRWYGFGNVTFGFYAAAALVLAGYLGHRYLLAHQRVVAAIAVAMVGFGVAACDGWPTMGADFGGVLTLVPVISWLTLAIAGLRITAPRMIAGATAAAAAATLIAWLDWRRGPAARSHLGNFVQRIIDGDAQDIVIRKAAAAAASLTGPFGIIAVLTGVLAWLAVFRVLPRLVDRFTTLRPVAIAALATAVIGSLVNDGGVSVWATITASFAVSVAALQTDRLLSTAVRQRQLTGETPLAGQGATAVP